MTTVVHWLNLGMRRLFELLLLPFRSFDPLWALLVVSLLSGLLMLWIYSRFSNQAGIREAKERIRGNLLGVRLFQHDIPVVLRLQGRILRDTLTYFRHSLVPLAVMLLPVLLILTQLHLFFGQRPLEPEGRTLVKLRLGSPERLDGVRLEASGGFEVETPPVRVARTSEAVWRVRATEPGLHRLAVQVGDLRLEKELAVGLAWGAVSSLRTSEWTDQLLYSGESPIPGSSGVLSLEVVHPAREFSLLGLRLDWLLCFLLFSLISAFGCKGLFGVEL